MLVASRPGCTTYTNPVSLTHGGKFPLWSAVPFTPIEGPFHFGGTRWTLLPMTPADPVTVRVSLGRDLGMAVDTVYFFLQPTTYRGADNGLGGAIAHVTYHDLVADGQELHATFTGVDDTGRHLRRGVYRVLVNLDGHRTSASTCLRVGPMDSGMSNQTETGFIFGLVSVGGARRPQGL